RELDAFNHVFVASSATNVFSQLTDVAVSSLPLAGYPELASASSVHPSGRQSLLVLGDADDCDCDVLEHALSEDLDVYVCGAGWSGRVPPRMIVGDTTVGDAVAPHCQSADFVYAVPTRGSAKFGLIPHIAYIAASCGATLLSPPIPAIEAVFGPLVRTFNDR